MQSQGDAISAGEAAGTAHAVLALVVLIGHVSGEHADPETIADEEIAEDAVGNHGPMRAVSYMMSPIEY